VLWLPSRPAAPPLGATALPALEGSEAAPACGEARLGMEAEGLGVRPATVGPAVAGRCVVGQAKSTAAATSGGSE
jgi:hypothetical protein